MVIANRVIDVALCDWRAPGGLDAAEIIIGFLSKIGIPLHIETVAQPSFLPGMAIKEGAIWIDPKVAAWPGDLLHEAGHIAVVPADQRALLNDVGTDGGDEMAAIAWSYAAAVACDIAPDILFHDGGYKGGSEALRENFLAGRFIGVPLLAYYGMTLDPQRAAESDEACYPAMKRWLR